MEFESRFIGTLFTYSLYNSLCYVCCRQKRRWTIHTCASQTILHPKRVECSTILVCLLLPVAWDAESYATSKILGEVLVDQSK